MTAEENSLIIIVWSKLIVARLLLKVYDLAGFQESIDFNLDAAQALLEQIIKENKRMEDYCDGGGI